MNEYETDNNLDKVNEHLSIVSIKKNTIKCLCKYLIQSQYIYYKQKALICLF